MGDARVLSFELGDLLTEQFVTCCPRIGFEVSDAGLLLFDLLAELSGIGHDILDLNDPNLALGPEEGAVRFWDIPSTNPEPDEVLRRKELMDLINEAVRRELSPERQEIFHLRFIEELEYDEIAERLGIERGTVSSRIHRVRQLLTQFLAPRLGKEIE